MEHAQTQPLDSLSEVRDTIQLLKQRIDALRDVAHSLDLPPIEQSEWYQLITQKLLPQLSDSSYLVVAVVGGTNIGKSVIFNHLCQTKASATSPLASGTKHPTCLVPERFADETLLQEVFNEFELVQSEDAADALQLSSDDILFWRELREGPENLLLLDTPDIDSDAEVNWSRADKVRRAADVLIAVLTQQKYNDAAVKKFFRIAAEEEKTILVVFNQCLLPEDEEYWPIWLSTFCRETGVSPEYVYVAPHDRRAAEQNQLPFYPRPWPLPEKTSTGPASAGPTAAGEKTTSAQDGIADETPHNLMEDLSQLKFEEIKLQSLSGAIQALNDPRQGIPSYLIEIEHRSGVHGDAWRRLTERLQEITVTWPTIPNRVVIQEIREWWREQRTGWQASVHKFYDTIGYGLMWPVRQFQGGSDEETPQWVPTYRTQEWQTIQQQLIAIYDRLESLSKHGNPVLAPRLNQLMSGHSREETIARLKQNHQECAFEQELKLLVKQQMQRFRNERKDWYRIFQRLDSFSAAARPAVTVALFATGFGPVGHAFMPVVADTAMQAALHVASDVTAGTVTAAVGETAISSGTSTGMRFLEAWFHQLHLSFVEVRQLWLLNQLQTHLWGTLIEDLELASGIPGMPAFAAVQNSLAQLPKLS